MSESGFPNGALYNGFDIFLTLIFCACFHGRRDRGAGSDRVVYTTLLDTVC